MDNTQNENTPFKIVSESKGLRADCIGKSFKKRPILRDVSISVTRGEAVGLLGPNGAGKTTSFYCIMGLVSPDYGNIYIDGTNITHFPMYMRARMGIGYLPQEASVFRSLNVEDNIRAVLEVVEKDKEKREETLESPFANLPSGIYAALRQYLFRAASVVVLKLPEHLPPSPLSSYLTSRWLALTPLPWAK